MLAAPPALLARVEAERTDEDLVAAVRTGDERAFEALYQRYHRRIAAYVNGMVNDHGRAEDLTQEVFMSALRRMRQTDRPIAFKPWVYEIAKNACIDAFRRSRRTEEISYDAEQGLGTGEAGHLVHLGPTPDVAVDTRMTLDNLRSAFGGLSETHHHILVMRELEGLSYREIGERLGMSRPSVESTLFRARRRLTEEYEELTSGERCRAVQALIGDEAGAGLGTRETRRMARHVSHCQPCRRHAALAGLDVALLAPARRPVREKVAALLPLPAFLKRRLAGDGGGVDGGAAVAVGQAQWAATLVGQYVEPAALSGWAKAAAAAVTIAVAGAGAGVATDRISGGGGKDEAVAPVLAEPTAARAAQPAAGATVRQASRSASAASAPVATARPARPAGMPAGGATTATAAGAATATAAGASAAEGAASSSARAVDAPSRDTGAGTAAAAVAVAAPAAGNGAPAAELPRAEVPEGTKLVAPPGTTSASRPAVPSDSAGGADAVTGAVPGAATGAAGAPEDATFGVAGALGGG